MHDINKIARRCCAESKKGPKRPKEKDEPVATKTVEVHLVQYIDRVVDVPVDEEPGDAEDAGSCCTKCYSDVEPFTDIPSDCITTIAVQAQTTENLADESLYFSGEAASGSHVMTQEVKVPVAGKDRGGADH